MIILIDRSEQAETSDAKVIYDPRWRHNKWLSNARSFCVWLVSNSGATFSSQNWKFTKLKPTGLTGTFSSFLQLPASKLNHQQWLYQKQVEINQPSDQKSLQKEQYRFAHPVNLTLHRSCTAAPTMSYSRATTEDATWDVVRKAPVCSRYSHRLNWRMKLRGILPMTVVCHNDVFPLSLAWDYSSKNPFVWSQELPGKYGVCLSTKAEALLLMSFRKFRFSRWDCNYISSCVSLEFAVGTDTGLRWTPTRRHIMVTPTSTCYLGNQLCYFIPKEFISWSGWHSSCRQW